MLGTEKYILLDVRTDAEFKTQRIEGATLIHYDEIDGRTKTELTDKNVLIMVYCRTGYRSKIAANTLIGMGYTNAYDLGRIETDWPY